MLRPMTLLAVLALLAGCGSDERSPASGNVFPNTGGAGGSGGTSGSGGGGIGGDSGLDGNVSGAAGTVAPDGGDDALADTSVDGPDPGIECFVDPIPATGQGYCVIIDGNGYQCDPITSTPCDVGAGETCEFDGERFRCVPQDFGLVAPCELCGTPYPNTCIPGFTCLGLGGKCTRYCCDSLQCAVGEFCVMQPPTSVGICQATRDDVFAGFLGGEIVDAGPIDAPPPIGGAECNPPVAPGPGDCVTVGTEFFACNPITNSGCGAGEACDEVGGKWQCVPGPHGHAICEPCTSASCKAGSTCDPTLGCIKYCCSNADCTPGVCQSYMGLGGLGTCREAAVPLGD